MYLLLLNVGGSVFGLFRFDMHYIVSFLVLNHHDKEEKAGCFTLIVFLLSCDC